VPPHRIVDVVSIPKQRAHAHTHTRIVRSHRTQCWQWLAASCGDVNNKDVNTCDAGMAHSAKSRADLSNVACIYRRSFKKIHERYVGGHLNKNHSSLLTSAVGGALSGTPLVDKCGGWGVEWNPSSLLIRKCGGWGGTHHEACRNSTATSAPTGTAAAIASILEMS
jgi:hypothetical protein